LLVDDHDESRELTEAALNSAGFIEVATAASAWDALNILDIWRADRGPTVDLILLDIVMPKMNGIETCARIRKDERYAKLPIIMLTALHDVESLSDAFIAGATDYIAKPFTLVELVARVQTAEATVAGGWERNPRTSSRGQR
jgi:DNA-binding response OmpR family regulator